jgi:predicted nucleotidyltransferase
MKCSSSEENKILVWFVTQAKTIAAADRIILFGSRARGDAHDLSDFDIAIETKAPERLGALREVVDENPWTLLAFDIVDLAQCRRELRDRIIAEGRDITQLCGDP